MADNQKEPATPAVGPIGSAEPEYRPGGGRRLEGTSHPCSRSVEIVRTGLEGRLNMFSMGIVNSALTAKYKYIY